MHTARAIRDPGAAAGQSTPERERTACARGRARAVETGLPRPMCQYLFPPLCPDRRRYRLGEHARPLADWRGGFQGDRDEVIRADDTIRGRQVNLREIEIPNAILKAGQPPIPEEARCPDRSFAQASTASTLLVSIRADAPGLPVTMRGSTLARRQEAIARNLRLAAIVSGPARRPTLLWRSPPSPPRGCFART